MARFGVLFNGFKLQSGLKMSICHRPKFPYLHFESFRLLSSITPSVSREKELSIFDDTFDTVVQSLTIKNNNYNDLKIFYKHFKEVLDYNVPHGKKIRGKTMMAAYKMLHANPNSLSNEELFRLQIMGWCVEMVQAFLLIADDLMDQSKTRRGQPCWFRKENIGLSAFNDAVLIEYGIFKILREYFSDQPYYNHVLNLFTNMYWYTATGQSIDMHSCYRPNSMDFKRFTIENYSMIVKYKTSWYTFYFPVALAMQLHNLVNPSLYTQVEEILLQIGHLFQIQDDYLDCYGQPAITGKLGTDVEDGKCSWLAVTALKHADNRQTQVMKDNYGKTDAKCVQRVKNVYLELEIPKLYAIYEENTYKQINTLIERTVSLFPKSIFHIFLDQIYQRKT